MNIEPGPDDKQRGSSRMTQGMRRARDTIHCGPMCKVSACLLVSIAILLLIILIPASLSFVEYHEYGLLKRRSTGSMQLDEGIYGPGRHMVGPDRTFKKFKADAHILSFEDLSVFSGDKLDMQLDVTIIYFIKKEQLLDLHEAYERTYKPVVRSRCTVAIKNTATKYKTDFFFQNRTFLEEQLFNAVRKEAASVFVDVTALYLAGVSIPDEVRERQLNVATQIEDNLREENMQESLLIRQETSRRVNKIDNEAEIVEEKAIAEAKLTVEKATADAAAIVETARVAGLNIVFEALNITSAEDKATLDYIRALSTNDNAGLYLNFDTLRIDTLG